mmetsp:Transcript_17182/g.47356  ORF Transcript_17182/g.47356 Transcript_17182/m.47356 type:complete len:200 (-) Transcript_17182:551-1150(-)
MLRAPWAAEFTPAPLRPAPRGPCYEPRNAASAWRGDAPRGWRLPLRKRAAPSRPSPATPPLAAAHSYMEALRRSGARALPRPPRRRPTPSAGRGCPRKTGPCSVPSRPRRFVRSWAAQPRWRRACGRSWCGSGALPWKASAKRKPGLCTRAGCSTSLVVARASLDVEPKSDGSWEHWLARMGKQQPLASTAAKLTWQWS